MNRQLKRANEKSDKRREREQERRKTQRRESRVQAVQTKRASQPKKDGGGKASSSSPRDRPAPGMGNSRFAGAYLVFVIFVIATQALVPQRTDTFSLVIHALFYLILGYFLVLYFYRRGVEQAFAITLTAGLGLALGVEGLKALLPQLGLPQMTAPPGTSATPNLLFVALAAPGLFLGTWLGRYIFKKG